MNPLFESITKSVLSSVLNTQGTNQQLIQNLIGMLNQGGQGNGLAALVQQFQANGLGDAINSWIGTGQNIPANASQIQQVIGLPQLQQLAASTGMNADQTANQLATMLPALIDKLTPNGSMDTSLVGQILSSLANSQKAA